jgi:DNA (cytosine-5)-methyltransferase 1
MTFPHRKHCKARIFFNPFPVKAARTFIFNMNRVSPRNKTPRGKETRTVEKGRVSKGTVVGLFSGIGGLERGFDLEGFHTIATAEIDPSCVAVLSHRMPNVPNLGDITKLETLPASDIVVAGFPCQPYSQAGHRDGLERGRAPLRHLLRLLERSKPSVVVLENVAFILHLHGGAAVTWITNKLAKCGYSWAFRVVDSQAFGLPQRRQRLIIVACSEFDAARTLLTGAPTGAVNNVSIEAKGFYWTEGSSGIGWADNAVPPLKGGSTLGIPCSPAIWDVLDGTIATPNVKDAERLQGFPVNWTAVPGQPRSHERSRSRLIGNAVSVPVARWVASRIAQPGSSAPKKESVIRTTDAWPRAAFGWNRRRYEVALEPMAPRHVPILDFLRYDVTLLSFAATRGFRMRYEGSTLRKDLGFLRALRDHEQRMRAEAL